MKRLAITLTTVVAVLVLSGTGQSAQAQEVNVQGPLAGAPAVINMRIYRQMRLQLQAHFSMTLQDQFSRAMMAGGQIMFHPADWLGLGVWASFAVANTDTALTDQIVSKGQTNGVNVLSLPNPARFSSQIGRINYIIAPEVAFIPLRGKLGIFEKLFVDADLYAFGGVGFVGVDERANVDSTKFQSCKPNAMSNNGGLASEVACLSNSQGARATRTAIAPTFGIGLSLYMAEFLAMTIEWRALPFAWNTSGTDEAGDARGAYPDSQINEQDRLSHFNHMISIGFAFYLPTAPKLSTAGNE
ncbi:MAG TPA: hypothetical protein VF331_09350 [Polyangiales bacterium]